MCRGHLKKCAEYYRFELKNFRGDVRQIITDVKHRKEINGEISYSANVIQSTDNYPFGWEIAERSFSVDLHRFGFNGKENDKEWGNQLIQDYGFRLYNPAIAKFLSVDPLAPDYPELTTYQFASNSPIAGIDLDGLEFFFTADGKLLGKYGKSNEIRIIKDKHITDDIRKNTKSYVNKHGIGKLKAISQTFQEAPEQAQINVATTIYEREVGAKVAKMSVNSADHGTGAHASGPGVYTVYPNLTQGGEYVNNDYYNQEIIWHHEHQHTEDFLKKLYMQGVDDFRHFDIEMKALANPAAKKMNEAGMGYVKGVLNGYLQGQSSYVRSMIFMNTNKSVSNDDIKNDRVFQYFKDKLEKNLKAYEKLFGEKSSYGVDYEMLFEHREKTTLKKE